MVRPVFGIALPVVLAAAIGGGFLSEPLGLIGLGAPDGAPNALKLSRAARAERARAAELTRGLAAAMSPSATPPQDAASPDSVDPDARTYLSRQGARQPGHLNYAEAYADAQVTLEEAFDLVGFQALFSPSRFVSTDSVRAARRMAAAGSNILRDYRAQEVRLEQSYNPGRSAASQTLRESYDRAESARALLAAADSLFGLLLAQDGRFVIRDRQIRFTDPAVGRRYSELRQAVVSRARAAPPVAREDEAVGALGRLRRAIGPDDPPFAVP